MNSPDRTLPSGYGIMRPEQKLDQHLEDMLAMKEQLKVQEKRIGALERQFEIIVTGYEQITSERLLQFKSRVESLESKVELTANLLAFLTVSVKMDFELIMKNFKKIAEHLNLETKMVEPPLNISDFSNVTTNDDQ